MKLNKVKVLFADPQYNYTTSVSAQTTEESATAYFKDNWFNFGHDKDDMQQCIAIEFTDMNAIFARPLTEREVIKLAEEDARYLKQKQYNKSNN